MNHRTILDLKLAYEAGTLRVGEFIREQANSVATSDPSIWIHRLTIDELQVYINRIETRRKLGEKMPLFGIPFAIKDNIDLEGTPTTAGCPAYKYIALESATVVQKLIDAGAIPLGKTNLDQFATGLVGVRSPYGVPRNVFDEENIPGGSSSGSAIAVAKGLVCFALGTDTAGSGRVPAALNHLVGLKPSRGLLSNFGVVPACRSLDCVSIFAHTIADTEAVLKVAQGFDDRDCYSRRRLDCTLDPVHRPCVGVPRSIDLEFFGNSHFEVAFREVRQTIESLGWTVLEIDFKPFLAAAKLLYDGPWVAERYAALGAFLEAQYEAFYPVTREIIKKGKAFTAVQTFESMYKLQEIRQGVDRLWNTIDALVTPTVGTTYKIAEVEEDPLGINANLGYYTNFVNLLDLCAVAIPSRLVENEMPFGITLAAPAFREERLLALANVFRGSIDPSKDEETPAEHAVKTTDAACKIAVCGAHLKGLPLHHQLTDLGALFVERTVTAPKYRLFALPNTTPAKPGLVRADADNGRSIEIEVYSLSAEAFGRFVEGIPSPLCIGKIQTVSGELVSGFLCESIALSEAEEITRFGSWRLRP